MPVRDSSFIGAFTWNRTGAPFSRRVGWEWTVQGRAKEGIDVRTESKMASISEQFAVVPRGARLRLCETDEGVRRHTSCVRCRHMSSVDIALA